jgi:DNA-binding SARP family transcriptional activator
VSDAGLELRLLGEMEIARAGARVELPPSKKTRGLLAYLVLTGRPHRRDRLCQLLWDVADDPRGALRWSLSRIRALVDEPSRPRILAHKDTVSFEAQDAHVDILALKTRAAAGLESASTAELVALAAEFRGELLEGLDLGDFLDFQAFCVAEREEARKLHAAVRRALVARLAHDPESALPHARVLAAVDPLNEGARAGLVRLLAATGRRGEAEQQYEAACRMRKELGGPPSAELDAALRSAREFDSSTTVGEAEPATLPAPPVGAGLVGRAAERTRLEAMLEETARGAREGVLLVTGEPGVGKSRLLDALRERARARGATMLEGRAFEAEAGRPYGPWIDALRRLPPDAVSPALGADLAALLPELARADGAPASRDRLFVAVVELLAARAGAAPPVVLAFDDVHWLDAASAELLHYVARMSRHRPLLMVLTARSGELRDNEATRRALGGLREMKLLEEMTLEPLGLAELRDLLAAVAPGADVERVFDESRGNPLLALELARALPDRDGRVSGSLAELIRHRVERLPSEAGDVLRWAAVLGSVFDADGLRELVALDLDRLFAALELLERHALLRARDAGRSSAYEFAHEVVRRAIYSELSQPRRRLMHLRVAERLERVEAAETVAADLAHHAALAGERGLAARACVRAGRRFLKQFANEEAWTISRRGRRHAAEVAEPERSSLLVELLQVELQARRPADVAAAAGELEELSKRALDQGDVEHARLGLHMLSYLRWEEGDFADAQRHMMQAELVSRGGDEQARIVAMAEAARCLVLLEKDLPRAEALALEASGRAARTGTRPSAIADTLGMLRQHRGGVDEAAELFEQARLEARREGDAMSEFLALEHLVTLRQQQGRWTEALSSAVELDLLGAKLREGSEAPFARALVALTHKALGEADASDALEAALDDLRLVDAKLRLAYTLTRAARLDLERGDAERARGRAAEAREALAALGRPTESLLAGLTLAQACATLGRDAEGRSIIAELRTSAVAGASDFARRELDELVRQAGIDGARRQEDRP